MSQIHPSNLFLDEVFPLPSGPLYLVYLDAEFREDRLNAPDPFPDVPVGAKLLDTISFDNDLFHSFILFPYLRKSANSLFPANFTGGPIVHPVQSICP